jgi:hypothetical protein
MANERRATARAPQTETTDAPEGAAETPAPEAEPGAIATRPTAAPGELVKGDPSRETAALLRGLGIGAGDLAGFEQTQDGGITKWVDLKAFQVDPMAGNNEPVKGNGKAFAGYLIGRHEIEDQENGEPNDDGVPVRHFFTVRLVSGCPVSYKNEAGERVREEAKPGEIVAIGERYALRDLRSWAEDAHAGAVYQIVLQPHSRIKTAKAARAMWTFRVFRNVIKPPMKVRAELVAGK